MMNDDFKRKSILSKILTALRGAIIPLRTEPAFRIHLFLVAAGVALAAFFRITVTEWIWLIMAAGAMVVTRVMNTAVGYLVNFISPEFHQQAKKIKDIGAGAVFIAGLTAFIIALIIFIPYFYPHGTP